MPRITEECVARIKDSADVVEIVGRYIQLRRAGNAWKACCPFHNEKTPSFSVNPARQTFKCFGCGVGGDAVKFIMMFENLDYPTALRRVADINGIPVIEEEENPEAARRRWLRSRVIEANKLAAEYYHRQLCRSKEADHVRAYLKSREFNIDIAKAWQLGWAPPDFQPLHQQATAAGMDARLLTEAYLLGKGSRGTYPVFRDRLMFPIHNVRGEVVGFSGRIMAEGQDPRKYVNTAETVAFRKGELLFGLFKATGPIAKAGMTVVVCEGQLDVIACHEKADIRNAVAGLGTAFTDEHAAMLRKYAKKAVLCYDGDNAGIKASEKTFRKLAAVGMDVYMAELPTGEDPDSLIRAQGAEPLRQAIEQARPYLEVRAGIELQAAQGDANARAALIPRMADLAAEITDPIRRGVAVTDLASRLNTGLDDLRLTVEEIIRSRKNAPKEPARDTEPDEDDSWDEAMAAAPQATFRAPEKVRPIRLHPTIRNLITHAAASSAIQHALVERIEELQEPITLLAGGPILQRLLEKLPIPGNAAAWSDFLQSLPAEQAAALKGMSNDVLEPTDTDTLVEQACARAARDAVEARIDILKARINRGNLSTEEFYSISSQMTELRRMLNAY
ncbi:MAG: DNA primase [Akkermansia sp.]|nr:DNA primase [Akkermansia sp.]